MDSFISAVITPVIEVILKPLVRELGYLFNSGANMGNLKEVSEKLKLRRGKVQREIELAKAESDEAVATEQVNDWMHQVETLEEDMIKKIVEDYNRPKTCLTACNYCWLRYKISKRAAKAVLKVEEQIGKQPQFVHLTERHPPAVRRMPTLRDVTPSSTEAYLSEAINYIQDDDVGMVGVWGMGGVGKTTLLKRINNHPAVADAGFDHVIWLVASQDLNIEMLRKDAAERVGLIKPGDAGVRAETLYHYLKAKKFLLLLDDLWEHVDLVEVGIPCPHRGEGVTPMRKVVFTTRSESVCDRMEAIPELDQVRCNKIKINCLQPEEAWKLFTHKVGEGMRSAIESDQRVGKRARIVAGKCDGLPLALVVIARAMSANKTWREWEDAINQINTIGFQEIKGADPFPLLKISYDRLLDDSEKNCFLRCALWPEDHKINVDELIDCWLGMNLIDYRGDINATYNSGYAIVERLKRACLLERVTDDSNFDWVDYYNFNRVKMHDVIRGMALWIVSSSQRKWMVTNHLEDESEDAKEWREAEIISLSYGRMGVLPLHPDCPNLSSLMLARNYLIEPRLLEDLFENMPVLTFLDLSYTEIEELPPAIGRMRQLRHLNLSHTRMASRLPVELGNLIELKVLLLNGLGHGIIPRGLLAKFRKLGHLGVTGGLHEVEQDFMEGIIPEGLLAKFRKLGHLGVTGEDEQDFMKELAHTTITSLECTLGRLETVKPVLAKNPPISFRVLEIWGLEGVTALPLASLLQMGNTSSTLSRLEIRCCDVLENISISNRCEKEIPNLEYFTLDLLPVLKKITISGSPLENVRVVNIVDCFTLKSAKWLLQCPRIESLRIERCFEMEHVIGDKEEAEDGGGDEIESLGNLDDQSENSIVFPHLTSLLLVYLPKLRSFSTQEIRFPSLKFVCMKECPLLDEAPFSHLENRDWLE